MHTTAFRKCQRASSAVEFALVFPLFLAAFFGIITYGSYLAAAHSVQQLAAEAARAAIGGLTDTERLTLAQSTVDIGSPSYPLITKSQLSVTDAATDAATLTFRVTLRYDASGMFVFTLPSFVPGPNPVIIRSAAIQRGGY
jgi:Flp pilus assembly protein TadG